MGNPPVRSIDLHHFVHPAEVWLSLQPNSIGSNLGSFNIPNISEFCWNLSSSQTNCPTAFKVAQTELTFVHSLVDKLLMKQPNLICLHHWKYLWHPPPIDSRVIQDACFSPILFVFYNGHSSKSSGKLRIKYTNDLATENKSYDKYQVPEQTNYLSSIIQ